MKEAIRAGYERGANLSRADGLGGGVVKHVVMIESKISVDGALDLEVMRRLLWDDEDGVTFEDWAKRQLKNVCREIHRPTAKWTLAC